MQIKRLVFNVNYIYSHESHIKYIFLQILYNNIIEYIL